MKTTLKIDFVSDVSCPWCVIGLRALEGALADLSGSVDAEIHFQPFELNPQMGPEGQNLDEHLLQKYGRTPEQFADVREAIRARGEELGFEFRMDRRNRIYNTFDAHRLLHWAEQAGRQRALKHALFSRYFTEGQAPSDHDVLVNAAVSVGLDAAQAREILASAAFADEVRAREQRYTQAGIHSVPAVIVNDQYLIQGGQPREVFASALRQIAEASTRT
ncbi:MAG: DsbA family oxidoreductase [Gammaproteobacteria bacterium]